MGLRQKDDKLANDRHDPVWLKIVDARIIISVFAKAGSKKNLIVGVYNDCLKVRIAAVPVEGAANKMLIAYLVEVLQCKKSDICIVKGLQSKQKLIAIDGIKPERVLASFQKYLNAH